MYNKSYSKGPCSRCGKPISGNGLAQYQHNEWHKRQDEKEKKERITMKKGVVYVKLPGPAPTGGVSL